MPEKPFIQQPKRSFPRGAGKAQHLEAFTDVSPQPGSGGARCEGPAPAAPAPSGTAKYLPLLRSPHRPHGRAAWHAADARGWSTGWSNASAPQRRVPEDAECGQPGLAWPPRPTSAPALAAALPWHRCALWLSARQE